jgi:GTPase SAR1 family protein
VQFKNHNTITQEKEVKKKQGFPLWKWSEKAERWKNVYQWACRLTTEQKEEEYLWTPETAALFNRLSTTSGNMIAVIGLQGSGKTALKQALQNELYKIGLKAFSFKWVGNPRQTIIDQVRDLEDNFLDKWDSEYFESLMWALIEEEGSNKTTYELASNIARRLKTKNAHLIKRYLTAFLSRDRDNVTEEEKGHIYSEISGLLPRCEKALGSKRVEEIRKQLLLDKLASAHTILIDLPDYDRANARQMDRDLASIQAWWESVFSDQCHNVYNQRVNLVIFFQKEIFHGHFFMGKLDVYELTPLPPWRLLQCYERNFKSYAPFTREAIMEIAVLSRGIFRRFKKYIRICLDKFYQDADCNTITVDLVRQWITVGQLIKDMELELMTIFPKEKELRVLSVKLLTLLREKGPLPQSVIVKEVFDGAKMKASRVLTKLESWQGYIKRERRGKEKLVCLA